MHAEPVFPVEGIETERVVLHAAHRGHADALRAFCLDNHAHFEPWVPTRDDAFYHRDAFETRLAGMERQTGAGAALNLLLFDKASGELIGDCNFSNVVRGAFQACHLGFSIGARFEGRGLMREAVSAAIAYVFDELGMHRVMANHRPENWRSERLLESLGFEREGFARAYLKINGVWADHVLRSLINPAGG
jgi:[ribosomal protein S5]-alanine N-acetyltransferase